MDLVVQATNKKINRPRMLLVLGIIVCLEISFIWCAILIQANGLRYPPPGGRWQCLAAEKTRIQWSTRKSRRIAAIQCNLFGGTHYVVDCWFLSRTKILSFLTYDQRVIMLQMIKQKGNVTIPPWIILCMIAPGNIEFVQCRRSARNTPSGKYLSIFRLSYMLLSLSRSCRETMFGRFGDEPRKKEKLWPRLPIPRALFLGWRFSIEVRTGNHEKIFPHPFEQMLQRRHIASVSALSKWLR